MRDEVVQPEDESVPAGPQIEVLLFWSGGPPVALSYPVDLARAYIGAACAVPGHGIPDLGESADPDDLALGLGYAFNAVVRAGMPIYGFDASGMWAFQPDTYRGIQITRSGTRPPSSEIMRRAIGFRPPAPPAVPPWQPPPEPGPSDPAL